MFAPLAKVNNKQKLPNLTTTSRRREKGRHAQAFLLHMGS
jgi:hypothetical protein